MNTAPGRLTTHVLDTAAGLPAAGLRIELFRIAGATRTRLGAFRTNGDGRVPAPLLAGPTLRRGRYELVFHVGAYFRARRNPAAGRFLDRVPVAFAVADPSAHYHVPLLVSPWAYSTYRGS